MKEIAGEHDLYSAEWSRNTANTAPDVVDDGNKFRGEHTDLVQDEDRHLSPVGDGGLVFEHSGNNRGRIPVGEFDTAPGMEGLRITAQSYGSTAGHGAYGDGLTAFRRMLNEMLDEARFPGSAGAGDE